jgi:preprotein translocase subunit SecD
MKSPLLASIAIVGLLAPAICVAGDLLGLKVVKAERVRDARDSQVVLLDVRLDEQSTRQFAEWTSRHLDQNVDLVIDGRVVMQPRVVSPITAGSLRISGASAAEVDALIPKLLDGRSALSVSTKD